MSGRPAYLRSRAMAAARRREAEAPFDRENDSAELECGSDAERQGLTEDQQRIDSATVFARANYLRQMRPDNGMSYACRVEVMEV
jgi:hypothetical protein